MAERKKRALEPSYQSGNRLLAALPALEYTRISRYLTTVMLDPRQEIARPNEPIEFVYFPIDSVTSIIALTSDGGSIEVATIGNEGMAGLPVFLGAESSPGYAFTQIAGSTERMNADDFRRESRDCESLRNLLKRYTQGFLTHISQATVCNQFHSTEQRLARWLLAVHDRVRKREFQITHQFISQMLGVRRETVTELAGLLQDRGLITYTRGRLTVRDRRGLERASCDCYRIIRAEFDRLLDIPVG